MTFHQTIQRFAFLLLFVGSSIVSFGQARKSYNNISYTAIYYSPYVGDFYYSLGIHATKYSGDYGAMIGSTKTTQGLPFEFSLNVGYQITNYISLRLDYTRYGLKSIIDNRPDRYPTITGLVRQPEINARNTDWSLNIVHDWFPKASIDNGERRYTPYSIVGFGFTTQRAQGSGGLGAIVPIGWGFKYYIFHNLKSCL